MIPPEEPITYASTGVDYSAMDPVKRIAQREATSTSGNIARFGFSAVEPSRGEAAFVVDEGDRYSAHVIEGLGTKGLVADKMRALQLVAHATEEITGKTYYDVLGQCTIAMIVNDLITVGADPVVINAYWPAGDPEWFKDLDRIQDLSLGWKKGCDLSGAVWGGGETPTLVGLINPEAMDLAGSGYGVIRPKTRLTLGQRLGQDDAILLLESSGIHANGLSMARKVASQLPEDYATVLPDGKSYGESLLTPTHIYAGLIRDYFEAGIDIHYMANITGHGWRKLMRANKELTYVIERVMEPHTIFSFIQAHSRNDTKEMYENLNMGAGFAVFMPEENVSLAQDIAFYRYGWQSLNAGHVENGPKRVIIKPKGDLILSDLEVR